MRIFAERDRLVDTVPVIDRTPEKMEELTKQAIETIRLQVASTKESAA